MSRSQCYLVATVIHIQSVCSQICVCVCVCVCSSQYKDSGGEREITKMGEQLMPRARSLSALTYTVIITSYGCNDCSSNILLSNPITEDGIVCIQREVVQNSNPSKE